MIKLIAIATAALALGACTPEPEPSGDRDMLLMQIAWDDLSDADRADACFGFNELGADLTYEVFAAEIDYITRDEFVTFFEDQC